MKDDVIMNGDSMWITKDDVSVLEKVYYNGALVNILQLYSIEMIVGTFLGHQLGVSA